MADTLGLSLSIHQNRPTMLGDRRKHGASIEAMLLIRPMHALNEAKAPKHMLRRFRRRLSDCDAISLARAVLETRGDESLGDAAARSRRRDAKQIQME